MKKRKVRLSCQSCGTEIECLSGELPCEALGGWLTLCCWEGAGTVSQYHFCSSICLKSWVDGQVPKIPDVFLESFSEDET